MLEQQKSTQLLIVIVSNLWGLIPLVQHNHKRIGPPYRLIMIKSHEISLTDVGRGKNLWQLWIWTPKTILQRKSLSWDDVALLLQWTPVWLMNCCYTICNIVQCMYNVHCSTQASPTSIKFHLQMSHSMNYSWMHVCMNVKLLWVRTFG